MIPNEKTIIQMTAGIRHVCENFTNRTAGSASERGCQQYFRELIGRYADTADLEEFSLHPNAFLGWIKIAVALSLLSIMLYWLSWRLGSIVLPIAGAALITVSVLMYLLEFLLYRRFIDFLFPKAASVNLFARRLPTGPIKRRIIFGGHADAPYEWTYSMHGKLVTLLPVMAGASLSLLFLFASDFALLLGRLSGGAAMSAAWRGIGFAQLCTIPFFAAVFFFVNWRVVTCGANDNLSGCYVAIAVLKELHDRHIRFENTEVCCLITGAEEAGLRGSLDFAKRHHKEMSQIETVFIALDTLRECEQLQVYLRGQTGTCKNSPEAAKLLTDSAKRCGIDLRKAGLYPGATDAEAFSRHGLKAAALCGVDHHPQTYYHTRKDNWYNVDPDCLEKALAICLEAVLQFAGSEAIDENSPASPMMRTSAESRHSADSP